MKNILKTTFVLLGTLGFLSVGAKAGDVKDLKTWSSSAGKSISSQMNYPERALRFNNEGAPTFQVTVNRAGKVVQADLLAESESATLNAAAKGVLRKARFPKLPASYKGEELTFSLQLNYAIVSSPKERRQLENGKVTTEKMAGSAVPMAASIKIIDQNG